MISVLKIFCIDKITKKLLQIGMFVGLFGTVFGLFFQSSLIFAISLIGIAQSIVLMFRLPSEKHPDFIFFPLVEKVPCKFCHGVGMCEVDETIAEGNWHGPTGRYEWILCDNCTGCGYLTRSNVDFNCKICHGRGKIVCHSRNDTCECVITTCERRRLLRY